MKTSIEYVTTFGVLLLGTGLWLFNNTESETTLPQKNVELAQAVNECDAITEKAAANLMAIVEFQKLEIVGRKANVFKTCMKDHGYKENPVWTKYAAPIATQIAKNSNTSVDEAFENLRRAKMTLVTSQQNEPLFWVLTKPN